MVAFFLAIACMQMPDAEFASPLIYEQVVKLMLLCSKQFSLTKLLSSLLTCTETMLAMHIATYIRHEHD